MLNQPGILRFGVFEVHLAAGELRKNGSRVKLQEQPFQVLVTLLKRSGEIVTREELKEKLWAGDTFVDFDHSLSTAVNKIREALGDSATSPRFNVAMDDAPFVRGLQTLADWCAARALFGDDEAQQGGNSNPSQNPIHRVPFLAPVSAKPRETSIWAPRAA